MTSGFKILVVMTVLSITGIGAVAAQTITTPAPGTAERKAILDAMRPQVEAAMRGPVVFVIDRMNVADNWAFVSANPQRPDGTAIDASKTGFAQDIEFMDGLSTYALLIYANERWNLVEFHVGPTDVSYSIWPEIYGVPTYVIGF